MNISSKKPKYLNNIYLKYFKKRLFVKATIFSILVFVFPIVLILIGYQFSAQIDKLKNGLNNFNLSSYIESYFIEIPHIYLDIKHENTEKLRYDRLNALKDGILVGGSEYVSSEIRFNGDKIKAKVRIKGNTSEHWQDEEKFSLKVKIKGDNTLFGMKEFSIMDPARRDYLDEWYYQKYLQYNNLIFHRYNFIDVTINGKNLGVYAIDEGIDKRLIENNRLREGPILSIDDDFYWNDFIYTHKGSYQKAYWIGGVELQSLKKTETDTVLLSRAYQAKNFLESYREGLLDVSKVFNLESTAKLFAISDLFGYTHPLQYHNVRFYYNPVTCLLEPIATDIFAIGITNKLSINERSSFQTSTTTTWEEELFKNKRFVKEYIKALNEISKIEHLNGFFQSILEEEKIMKAALSGTLKAFYKYNFKAPKTLYTNQNLIRKTLNPLKMTKGRITRERGAAGTLYLEVGNTQILPVECLAVLHKDSVIVSFDSAILLKGKIDYEQITYNRIALPSIIKSIFPDSLLNEINIKCRILGTDSIVVETIDPIDYNYYNDTTTFSSNFTDTEYLEVDENAKIITFKKGKWTIKDDLIIPKGYRVMANSELTLNLINSAMIKSYSPVYFMGNQGDHIIISSNDSTGQGLLVLNTSEKSVLKYVDFLYLLNPSKNGLLLTGAITFYEANVSIKNCLFFNNKRGDDYLNIIRSEFDISQSLFSKILADAFDSDFSQGIVSNTSFVNIGNDAIDISGTNININDVLIYDAKDKGLSAGEGSKITGENIKVENSEIAVCSKDNSEILISNLNLQNDKIGFTAFQKKSEFGPGKINVTTLEINNVAIPYLIEKSSECVINGEIKASNNKKIKDILYGVKYGKSSK
jgi:hypothetical protein